MVATAGFEAQFGFVDEVTYGTGVTVSRFLEFVSEGVKADYARIESKGIRKGRRTLHRWGTGKKTVTGPVEFELSSNGMGLLFKHMLGGVSTSGAGPYTHTFTPAILDGKSFTFQIGRPDDGGTVRAFTYPGGKVASWELSADLEDYAKLSLDLLAADETVDAPALATAAYPASYAPFTFVHGSLTVGGTATDVRGFSLKGDNKLTGARHFMRATNAQLTREPKENGQREYTGQLDVDFVDLTAYTRYTAGTEAALVMTFDAGAASKLVITANVRFDGETPNVGGMEKLEQALPFKCVSGTSDTAALSIVLTNSDTTP